MSNAEAAAPDAARVFAALGDPTRLGLVQRLGEGAPCSMAQLCQGAAMSRQAVTKHLRVLEGAGLVGVARAGRESRYTLRPEPLRAASGSLDAVTARWDEALARLRAHVEASPAE